MAAAILSRWRLSGLSRDPNCPPSMRNTGPMRRIRACVTFFFSSYSGSPDPNHLDDVARPVARVEAAAMARLSPGRPADDRRPPGRATVMRKSGRHGPPATSMAASGFSSSTRTVPPSAPRSARVGSPGPSPGGGAIRARAARSGNRPGSDSSLRRSATRTPRRTSRTRPSRSAPPRRGTARALSPVRDCGVSERRSVRSPRHGSRGRGRSPVRQGRARPSREARSARRARASPARRPPAFA